MRDGSAKAASAHSWLSSGKRATVHPSLPSGRLAYQLLQEPPCFAARRTFALASLKCSRITGLTYLFHRLALWETLRQPLTSGDEERLYRIFVSCHESREGKSISAASEREGERKLARESECKSSRSRESSESSSRSGVVQLTTTLHYHLRCRRTMCARAREVIAE